MFKKLCLSIAYSLMFLLSACANSNLLVADQAELKQAIKQSKPGQTIVMKNGVWSDIEIIFKAEGKKDAPIQLVAQNPGQVIISGQSNLSLAGNYLVVRGLVFKDGYSPTGSVISFRKSKKQLANHSRVTETVIDRFNKPERFESDIWVSMFGKNNQFDHNHLVGKMNKGVTMAVRLDTEGSRENNHRIEYNYFGPRPVLGSNGGETLRVGTSHYSLSESRTLIENNVFDQCDGEVEIISIKSGANVIRGNLFKESAGTLTLRHGNGNTVEDNVFLGNGKLHTGGIRVINADHTIRNNYLSGLTGYRFGGGLVVMNGVPNSPINRYHQVKNVVVENNTLVDVDHVQLAAGADSERSAKPQDTEFKNNLFVSTKNAGETVTAYDDISGIAFSNNAASGLSSAHLGELSTVSVEKSAADLLYSPGSKKGASGALKPIALESTGVSWYPKGDLRPKLDSGSEIKVKPADNGLVKAIAKAKPGDVLLLAAGEYHADRVLMLKAPITIRAEKAGARPLITFDRNALFQIEDGASLRLDNIDIDGSQADDSSGNNLIRTTRYGMLNNYSLLLDGVRVSNLDINHTFNFLKVAKSTMADQIVLRNSEFTKITGDLLKLDAETDDLGIFNVDYLTIDSSSFKGIEGAIAKVYRGGRDESTFGPHVSVSKGVVKDVGFGKRNASQASFALEGVQVVNFDHNTFESSALVKANSKVGEPKYSFSNNQWGKVKPQITYKNQPVSSPL